MKSIDVFCHLMPRRYTELATRGSPNRSRMFLRALKMRAIFDTEYRQTVITESPEYKQIPNIVSPLVELFAGPDQPPGITAVDNDEIKKITDEHPESYEELIAGMPFNNVAASIMKIKRCKGMGAGEVQIYAHMNGETIDRGKFWSIHETCETLDLPILVHSVGGRKVPEFPVGDASKYELWLLIGWLYQTTVAISRLILAGIFEDFPDLEIATHHVGAVIPILEGRTENGLKMYGGRTAPELKEKLTRARMKGNLLDIFKKFYADTASFGPAVAIRCGVKFLGRDHVLFVSDVPSDLEQGPGYTDRTLKAIDNLGLSAKGQLAILFDNAKRILRA